MTTLILLCLALIGAGVFLLAPQARAMGEMPIMRKMLFAVVAGMLLLSGCTTVEKNWLPAYSPIPLHTNLDDTQNLHDFKHSQVRLQIWILENCRTRSRYGKRVVMEGANGPYAFFLLESEQCTYAFANLKGAEKKMLRHEAEQQARQVKELARSVVEMKQAVKEKVASFRSKLNLKQYCEVVLDGTAFLREIQEYNENGLGAQVKNARIPDGELHGIIEVAKQGCNPE